jgi:hypothetical protein
MENPAQPPESPMWRIIVGGDTSHRICEIVRELTSVGREPDNDISLDDPQVSRYHARLILQGDHLIIEDLDSANGTLLNERELIYPTVLHVGDVISLGQHTLKVDQPPAEASPVTTISPVTEDSSPRRLWPFLLAILLGLAVVVLFLGSILVGRWFFLRQQAVAVTPSPAATVTVPDRPVIVVNQAPAAGAVLPLKQSVTIQATAVAVNGVTRVELWVDDRLVEQVDSPLGQSASSMTVAFRWIADTPGMYTLRLKAYGESGQPAETTVATVTVAGDTPAATATLVPATATSTITPLPATNMPTFTPTPTVTKSPLPTTTPTPLPPTLRVGVPLLNVRSGPGTGYTRVGALQQGDEVTLVGRTTVNGSQWWQIQFAPAPGGTAWVSGNTAYVTVSDPGIVPVGVVPLPPTAELTPVSTQTPVPMPPIPSATLPPAKVRQAPPGKTLLIISNRSLTNQPARLTLSGGKSVGGGLEIDPPPGEEVELVLEPDFYRAMWSAPWNSFTRGVDFTAVAGKIVVQWIVPEDGVTVTEVYDELLLSQPSWPTPSPVPTPLPESDQPLAPPGLALLVASNRSVKNEYGLLTIAGGNFGGGQEFILDANTERQLELVPGYYRTVWHSPAFGGVNAGREFQVSAGEVIYGWIVPEDRNVFMQFPDQPVEQINN